ncbi:MAG: hypothetical protein DI596_05425 [Azospira oryzae]|nr:MAG: hypothetical protein DI596_05425 [Azospira oryzae]PZP80886.1 MAG: hypothetical protein DI593_05425 [Azospira oryzae]
MHGHGETGAEEGVGHRGSDLAHAANQNEEAARRLRDERIGRWFKARHGFPSGAWPGSPASSASRLRGLSFGFNDAQKAA